ncbi:hypothetical protein [Treponema sp.]|uniref:hypothetical protein n=1 Tax=Treponema sp. TaxID=166 RepID=UPI00388F5A1A
MKKFCFLSSIFVLIFISCSLNQEQKGSLSITLPEAGTTRSLQEDVVKFQVTVSGPTAHTTPFIAPGTVIPIDDLIPGFYTVSVYGYDNNSKKIAQGTNTAAVEGGIKNDVTVEISRAPQDPWEYEPHLPEFEIPQEGVFAQFFSSGSNSVNIDQSNNPYIFNTEEPTKDMFIVAKDGVPITEFTPRLAEGFSYSNVGQNKVDIFDSDNNFITDCYYNSRYMLKETKITSITDLLTDKIPITISIGKSNGGLTKSDGTSLQIENATVTTVTVTSYTSGKIFIKTNTFEVSSASITLNKSDLGITTSGSYFLTVALLQKAKESYTDCFNVGSDAISYKSITVE